MKGEDEGEEENCVQRGRERKRREQGGKKRSDEDTDEMLWNMTKIMAVRRLKISPHL